MIELLRQRRSVRKFESKPVEAQKVETLVEAALRSPSSRGRNPWEFIVVTDSELLQKLGCAKEHGSAFLSGAPLAVVVAADPEKCDVWVEDCAIAAIILQLTAESLGLSSCWAQIRLRPHDTDTSAEEYIKQLLGLPERLVIDCVIGIGYGAEEKVGHSRSSLCDDQIHSNRYKS